MADELKGLHIAALMEEGFEQVEFTGPRQALERAGAQVELISPHTGSIRSWEHREWGKEFQVDVPLKSADPTQYDGLLLPGGVQNPDRLRRNPDAWRFVQHFFGAMKPVGAICHAPWLLIDSGVIDGRRLTSWPSLQTDLKNAGADWVDQEVVVDRGLVTSRGPQDIPVFSKTLIAELAKARKTTPAPS